VEKILGRTKYDSEGTRYNRSRLNSNSIELAWTTSSASILKQ
jgi:hypothetical protein